MVTDARAVSVTAQRQFYRNGQLREEVPLRNGRRHGVLRTWHRNGVLATEEPYEDGLLHGICRQWNEQGKLLGEYRMVHGTGTQQAWHDNGQLQIETSTVQGEFCGQSRMWLRDGTLLSEKFHLHGKTVSADEYRAAAARDRSLPGFQAPAKKPLPSGSAREKRIHRAFVRWLLEKSPRSKAREWIDVKNGTRRSLGYFESESDAEKFFEALHRAGAVQVIVSDIYRNRAGDQFSDGVLVQLPKDPHRRKAIRAICEQMKEHKLGAIEPQNDIGETYLFLSMA